MVKYYEPIWENQLKLKLGQDHNFEIFSIVLLFKDKGVCIFHSDPELQVKRIGELNKSKDASKFDHPAFKNKQLPGSMQKEELNLMHQEVETFGIWNVTYLGEDP